LGYVRLPGGKATTLFSTLLCTLLDSRRENLCKKVLVVLDERKRARREQRRGDRFALAYVGKWCPMAGTSGTKARGDQERPIKGLHQSHFHLEEAYSRAARAPLGVPIINEIRE
jgi:hypothetical protein